MLLAILIIVCAAFVIQCCVFNKAVSERRFRSAEDILTTIAEDLSGSTRNSAEYYNAVKQIHTDIKCSSDDFSADVKATCKDVKTAADGLETKLAKAAKSACADIALRLKPAGDELGTKISEMKSAVDALIEAVTITRNPDGVVPTELLKELVEATDKEDRERFADAIGKAKRFLDLYEPVAGKIVREKAIKKVTKPKRNYGFF